MKRTIIQRRLLLAGFSFLSGVAVADEARISYGRQVKAVLDAHCKDCHSGTKAEAKVDLDRSADALMADRDLWFRVLDQLESGLMPPEDEEQPEPGERERVIRWIKGDFSALHLEKQRSEGRSMLRRLSRNEYADTVQDLTGLRPTVGINLPEDNLMDGYDKVGGALGLSASGAAGYVRMTEDVLKWMLRPLPQGEVPDSAAFDPARTRKAPAKPSEQSKGHILELPDGAMVSFNSDLTSGPVKFAGAERPGIHRLKISAYAYQTDKPLVVGIYAGHVSAYPQILELAGIIEVPSGKPALIATEVYLRTRDLNDKAPVGDGIRFVPFGLGVPVPKNHQASECKGPGLALQWVEVESPALPLQGDRWLTADLTPELDQLLRKPGDSVKLPPEMKDAFLAVMRTTFGRIGTRLYRREFGTAELEEVMARLAVAVDAGLPVKRAFLDEVALLMTSPDFLCLVEEPGKLSGHALATRLSYFLWSSTPDDELMEVAARGGLQDPVTLRQQTERLLADPKAERFVTDFAKQWLGLRAINDTSPDGNLYPEYGEFLKLSSVWETEGFLRRMLRENIGVKDLVAADWTMANGALAAHYGISGVEGAALRLAKLPTGSPFGGIWTQSSVMKVTANGTVTSPVKRGRWMAERLLGTPIPPPPPGIKPVEPDVRGAKTLREQFAMHAEERSCSACHARFDPYGFALESFDVMGNHRGHYRVVDQETLAISVKERKPDQRTWKDGLPVDSSGKTPGGTDFANIRELRTYLADRPELLANGVTRHLVTYATGTVPTPLDQPAIDGIVAGTRKDGYGLRALIHGLIQSELFQWK